MTQPSSNKPTLLDWLDTQEDNMVTLLRDLVNIDSNSFDKAGVDRVADRLGEFFDEQSIPFETIPIATHGDGMRAVVAGGNGNRPILLCGHRDTVFPTGEVEKRPFEYLEPQECRMMFFHTSHHCLGHRNLQERL